MKLTRLQNRKVKANFYTVKEFKKQYNIIMLLYAYAKFNEDLATGGRSVYRWTLRIAESIHDPDNEQIRYSSLLSRGRNIFEIICV